MTEEKKNRITIEKNKYKKTTETSERIVILCDEDFKSKVKKAILRKGFTKFKDGYYKIFEIGFENFEKGK